MPWFYNSHSGELTNQSGVSALLYEALIHAGIGWHQLNIPGSDTFAQAAADALKEVPGGATPTANPLTAAGQAAGQAAGAAASGISQSVLGPLFQANIWIRVGEFVLGLVLIAVGLARLTHAVPVATKIATAVGTKGLA